MDRLSPDLIHRLASKAYWWQPSDISSGGLFRCSCKGCSHGTLGFQVHSSWIQFHFCWSVWGSWWLYFALGWVKSEHTCSSLTNIQHCVFQHSRCVIKRGRNHRISHSDSAIVLFLPSHCSEGMTAEGLEIFPSRNKGLASTGLDIPTWGPEQNFCYRA